MRPLLYLLVCVFTFLLALPTAVGQSPGTILWQFPTGDYTYGAPVVDASGNVYIASMNGKLRCLDSNGSLLWTYTSSNSFRGTPNLDRAGRIYICDQGAFVHKIRISDGSRVWRVNLAGALHSDPKPAISPDGSQVFVGSVDTAQSGRLWALSTSNGSVQWTGQVLQWSSGLYDRFERNDILISPTGNVVAMGWDAGSLVTFQTDGSEEWSRISAFNNYPSNFVIDPQGRIFGFSYWGFRAFDADGGYLWDRWDYLYAGNDALAIGPDNLIFAAYGGRVRGHDRDNGNVLWSHTFSYGALQIAYEPIRKMVYTVGTDYQDRQLLALNQYGAVQWQVPWPGFANRAAVPSADGSVLYIVDQDGVLYAISTGEAPPALDLTTGILIRGLPADLTVQAANAGESVHFLYSLNGIGNGPCPPILGGLCLDILAPVRNSGSAQADGTGKAVLRVQVPSTAPMTDVHLQAVARRGANGAWSVKSNTVTSPIH